MRTHQNNSKDKKVAKRHNKKVAAYTVVLCTAVAIIALAIILPLTLGNRYNGGDGEYTGGGNVNPPPPPPPPAPVQVVTPMETFTVGKLASLDRLVFHSSMNQWRTHNGVNFNAAIGTEVRSIKAGTVLSVEHTQLEGTIVTIQHVNGFVSAYHGLAIDARVEEGDTVHVGEVLGTVAAVRPIARSEGSHLHLRVRQDGNLIDPLTLFPELSEQK